MVRKKRPTRGVGYHLPENYEPMSDRVEVKFTDRQAEARTSVVV
jgi:hypothetical protein